MRIVKIVYCFLFFSLLVSGYSFSQDKIKTPANILYINSYSITYSWGDSVASGIIQTFKKRPDLNLYVEYLDSKRFGKTNFKRLYELLKSKYGKMQISSVIISDNDALDFFLQYGDSIVPAVPVAFCGVNNPEDYKLEGTRFYGIKEGLDQDSLNRLILKVIPSLKILYFIADSTTTSLVNLEYLRQIEPRYKGVVKFEYITNVSIDALLKIVPTLEKGNAIALIDIFQDLNKKAVNPDLIVQQIAKISPVPIFIDSQPSFGKGILGGIINSGADNGREVAKLSIKFADNPDFVPENRIFIPKDNYSFDYNILQKYHIELDKLPKDSILINMPQSTLERYFKYIVVLILIVALQITIIFKLLINIKARKKAEETVKQKLLEIQDQYTKLEESTELLNESNHALKIAKEKSEESDRLKSSFLANLSHEIRTPMNAIVGFGSLLEEDDLPKEELSKFVGIINTNSNYLLKLINDILDISKIESGQIKIYKKQVSPDELILHLVQSFAQSIQNKEVEIRIKNLDEFKNKLFFTDPLRLNQVLSNLISNAVKFTDKGIVEIACENTNNNEILFHVSDTGIGIEEKNLSKVFDRFWKIEEIGSSLNPGTGIGLALSQKICELLGGKIWVESKIHAGSTFYFSLPGSFTDIIEKNDGKPAFNSIQHSNLKGKLIAIAEDVFDNMNLLIRILKKYEVEILSFDCGEKIVDYFIKTPDNKVNLILMDIKMPGIDGYDAAKMIKDKFPDIPIIAQTAYAMNDDIVKIMNSSFNEYVIKPIKETELLNKMSVFLC